jgi:translocation and assembly module TamB
MAGLEAPWKANLQLVLDRFPLHRVSGLYDHRVRGTVSGLVTLEGLHDDARANVAMTLAGLQVGDVAFKDGQLDARLDGQSASGTLRVDEEDGNLEAHADLATRWGRALAPSLDAGRSSRVTVSTHQFRAAFFQPLVSRNLMELDGRISGDAGIVFGPSGTAMRPQAQMTLQNGTFELATFGSEFHDAGGRLTVTPDGSVRLDDLVAHGLSGTVRAAASAHVDGLALTAAQIAVQIPSKDPLPLIFDGLQMGVLDGRFDVGIGRAAGGGLDVNVAVESAHVQLPTASTSLDVQPLGEIENVEVGVRRSPSHFDVIGLDAAHESLADARASSQTPTHVVVALGRDVRVSRGTMLDVRLEGQPSVAMAEKTAVSGQVRLPPGGIIEVEGKRFEIENGFVTFVGDDPSNPQVVLTAGWTAPDDTRIFADFIGPLKSAQLKLRSVPAKTQKEIVSLLLYGTGEDDTLTTAAAAGAAAQPVNQVLGGVNRALGSLGLAGGIATKLDSNLRPDVEVQITRDISLQVAWVLGTHPPMQPDSTLLTLDWRFLRKWSLETTVGDEGTSIFDVIWQHRY